MKQMQEFSVQTDFSFSVSTPIESSSLNWLGAWIKQKMDYLAANRRNLLLTAAATLGITTVILATSYLFFVQLAAFGW